MRIAAVHAILPEHLLHPPDRAEKRREQREIEVGRNAPRRLGDRHDALKRVPGIGVAARRHEGVDAASQHGTTDVAVAQRTRARIEAGGAPRRIDGFQPVLQPAQARSPGASDALHSIGMQAVVGVEEDDHVPACVGKAGIERRSLAAIRLDHRDNAGRRSHDLGGTVGRPVVDDHHLARRQRLVERAADRVAQVGGIIVAIDDDADADARPIRKQRARRLRYRESEGGWGGGDGAEQDFHGKQASRQVAAIAALAMVEHGGKRRLDARFIGRVDVTPRPA